MTSINGPWGRARSAASGRPGYVLIAVLVVIVVLSLTAYQFVEAMTSEYRAAARTGDVAQAKLAAMSGVHYTIGMICDPATFSNDLGGNPYDAGNALADVVVNAGDGRRQSRFTVVSSQYTGGSLDNPGSFTTRYGVIDEAGKLNINTLIQLDPTGQVLHDALMLLPNMTEEVADAIVDWVDKDDDTRAAGAESSYYLSLSNPYRTKNGPLNSIDELLFVRGVSSELLHGTDANRNGVADDGPSGSAGFTRGWAEYLTVYGRELNVDSTGALRLYVGESEDMPGIYAKLTAALGQEMADYVMAFKIFASSTATATTTSTSGGGTTVTVTVSGATTTGANTVIGGAAELNAAVQTAMQGTPVNRKLIKSLLDMYGTQVTLPKLPAQPGQPASPTVYVPCPLNDPAKLSEMLPLLMDKTTATTNVEIIPRLNVNTAPREVLLTVPGWTEADVDLVVEKRVNLAPTDPATMSGAWVMTVAGVTPATFKKVEKYITGRTMVYRVQAIGYSGTSGGPVARVEAVFDTNQGAPRILYFRDLGDLDTPRGFSPPSQQQ